MNFLKLESAIRDKKSFLCIGLDPDLKRIPEHLLKYDDPVFEFNKIIIDATMDYCVAYKPNLAFYEKLGPKGLVSLEKTLKYIPEHFFKIADAKRSDIFNSASMYADTFYDHFDFDAVTISPYMGVDAVKPFLRKNKCAIILLATSNSGASAVQNISTSSGQPLYLELITEISKWGSENNIMFVVGASRTDEMLEIRRKAPNHFFLVPGIGAQGGDMKLVCKNGLNKNIGLLVNVSRAIIYASSGHDFEKKVSSTTVEIQKEMQLLLEEYKILQ